MGRDMTDCDRSRARERGAGRRWCGWRRVRKPVTWLFLPAQAQAQESAARARGAGKMRERRRALHRTAAAAFIALVLFVSCRVDAANSKSLSYFIRRTLTYVSLLIFRENWDTEPALSDCSLNMHDSFNLIIWICKSVLLITWPRCLIIL